MALLRRTNYSLVGGLSLAAVLISVRVYSEIHAGSVSGGSAESFVSSRFDPRDLQKVDEAEAQRESDRFKNRLFSGGGAFFWPGLKSLQVSSNWLQLLQGVHAEASYEGDFSWVFSKLDFIEKATPREERSLLVALAPFYFLVNRDGAGATYLMNSMLRRAPDTWRVWFWSGYHALENLKNVPLAGDLYRQAAMMPGSPLYLGALSYRLSNQELFLRVPNPKNILEKDLPEELLRKIKATRPEW
jgi:hypothetical protein